MPAAPNPIINNVTELILNHIRQTSDDLEGALNPARTNGTELERIDRNIESLEETLISLQISLNTQLVRRKKQRNGLIRFNQLPLEIASAILWLSIVDPWPQKTSYSFFQRQQTISSVCSSWWTLVQDSPRFWSTIEFSCRLGVISHFLEKSQSRGLHIKSFEDSSGYNCGPRDGFTKGTYLGLIAAHAHRIRSLILSFRSGSTDGLLTLLGKPAPMLEELKLDIAHCNFEQPLDLFCGQASQLRDVALDNIPVRWDSDVLVGLRSLDTKEKVQYLPTDGQMRRLLEANPGLEKMDIEAWDETDTEHSEEDAVQSTREGKPSRVVMSKLHDLRLFNLPLELVQAVLGHIEIPSIGYFMLRCLFQGRPASRLLGPSIKHLASPLLQRSKGAQRAELTFEESSIELAIYTPHHEIPTIQMQLRETVLSNGFDWLAENFFHAEGLPSVGAADIFRVSLKFQGGFDMEGGKFIPILDRLNAVKVKDLTIECWGHRGEELIKYLGTPKEDSQWPLPHLTSMTIDGPAELADHLLIALQRREQYAPAGDTSAAPRPVALEVLDIGGLRGVDEDVEKTLANCVASSGTFIPASQGWGAGGRTPNPYGGGMTPAWVGGATTPTWGGGATTPNPYASGMTPNPYAGAMTPNPYAGGMSPTWEGGGATPNSTHWEGDVFGAGNNESI